MRIISFPCECETCGLRIEKLSDAMLEYLENEPDCYTDVRIVHCGNISPWARPPSYCYKHNFAAHRRDDHMGHFAFLPIEMQKLDIALVIKAEDIPYLRQCSEGLRLLGGWTNDQWQSATRKYFPWLFADRPDLWVGGRILLSPLYPEGHTFTEASDLAASGLVGEHHPSLGGAI